MYTIGLIALFVLVVLVFSLPRQYVILPFLICICYLTYGVALNIAGLNFTALRTLGICGFIRVAIRGELSRIGLNKIDSCFIAWAVVGYVLYSISHAGMGLFAYKSALTLDALCMYFCFRSVILDFNDIKRIIRYIGILIIPLSVLMLYEYTRKYNVFSGLGGGPEIPPLRDGKVRCRGPFRCPITAGMMGATVMPFFIWQWLQEKKRTFLFLILIMASSLITYTASSSGALLTFFFEIFTFPIWFFRDKMRLVRRSIVMMIVVLSIVMKAPFWYILARLSGVAGGTGWHRAYLIDKAFSNIGRWWLAGTSYTADWFPYTLGKVDPNNSDITNMFLVQGVTAGLITMILFIMIIVRCYKYIGVNLKSLEQTPFTVSFLLWTLGVVLTGHIVGFFSISYFDQMIGMWYLILAMISSSGNLLQITNRSPEPQLTTIEGAR